MRKFAQPVGNKEKFDYVYKEIHRIIPGVNPLFAEILSNIFVYETQDVPLDKVVKNIGDYKTVFGITPIFLKDLLERKLTLPNFNKLTASQKKKYLPWLESLSNLYSNKKYDPAKLDLEYAVKAVYLGYWMKLSLEDFAPRFPTLTRLLFDFAFNSGAEQAANYFKRALNVKAQEAINEKINKKTIPSLFKNPSDSMFRSFNEIAKAMILPKNRYQIVDNKIEYIPIKETGRIIKGDGTFELLSYLDNSGYSPEYIMAQKLNKLRSGKIRADAKPQHVKGLINRLTSLNEMVYEQNIKDHPELAPYLKAVQEWRKANPNFHKYIRNY